MSDRTDEIMDRLATMETAFNEQAKEFSGLRGELRIRCPEHERRLGDLERKRRNGNGTSAGATGLAALGLKAVLYLTALAADLATIISTLVSRLTGAH